jgi:hypothetical protein
MTTIDDVLLAAPLLKRGQVAQLLGYRSLNQVGDLKTTGRTIPTKRLAEMAAGLRAIADAIEQLPTPADVELAERKATLTKPEPSRRRMKAQP